MKNKLTGSIKELKYEEKLELLCSVYNILDNTLTNRKYDKVGLCTLIINNLRLMGYNPNFGNIHKYIPMFTHINAIFYGKVDPTTSKLGYWWQINTREGALLRINFIKFLIADLYLRKYHPISSFFQRLYSFGIYKITI